MNADDVVFFDANAFLGSSQKGTWQPARDFPSVLLDVYAVMDERTGVLAVDITDDDRRNTLHRNARKLFGFGDGRRAP